MNEEIAKPRSRCFRISWLCAFSSPVLIVALVAYVIHTRLALSHWPIPHTDYDLGPFYDVHVILFGCIYLFAVYGALPLWFICLLFPRLRPSRRERWLQPAIFLGSWAVIVLAACLDSTTFTKWFLD